MGGLRSRWPRQKVCLERRRRGKTRSRANLSDRGPRSLGSYEEIDYESSEESIEKTRQGCGQVNGSRQE